jgi:glutamate 5-kinase
MGYAAAPKGRLLVDAGAARAITVGKRSLLAVGVSAVEGGFGPGEVVEIADPSGRVIARGLAGYASEELDAIKGLPLSAIAARLGADRAHPAVHRDELVTQARGRRPGGG